MRTMTIQAIRGWRDYWSRDKSKFYPFGFAMNGQTARLEATRQIIYALEIKRIVETGTYRGTTTEWFGQFGIPVETVECDERFYVFSKKRLSAFKNIEVNLGSSVSYLRQRNGEDIPELFYLDAHWEHHLPLREELQLIFQRYTKAVVLIDDFRVDDDPGYGYDSFGPDAEVTLDYVRASKLQKLDVFYPAVPSMQETGAKRGWAVLTTSPKMAQQLGNISLLRLYNEGKPVQDKVLPFATTKIRDLVPGMRVMLNNTTCATVSSIDFDDDKPISVAIPGGYVPRALRVSFENHEPISAHPHNDIQVAGP